MSASQSNIYHTVDITNNLTKFTETYIVSLGLNIHLLFESFLELYFVEVFFIRVI